MSVLVVIPARYASSRYPGKPLVTRLKPKHAYVRAIADIAGRAVPASGETGTATKGKRKWLW